MPKKKQGLMTDEKFKKILEDEWKTAMQGAGHSPDPLRRPKTAKDCDASRHRAARRVREQALLRKQTVTEKQSIVSDKIEEERVARLGGGRHKQSREEARDRLRLRREMLLLARNVEVKELMGAGNDMSAGSGSEFQQFLKDSKRKIKKGSNVMSEEHKRRMLRFMTTDYVFNPVPGECTWMPSGAGKKAKSPLNRSQRLRADKITQGIAFMPDFVEDYYNLPNTMNWHMTTNSVPGK